MNNTIDPDTRCTQFSTTNVCQPCRRRTTNAFTSSDWMTSTSVPAERDDTGKAHLSSREYVMNDVIREIGYPTRGKNPILQSWKKSTFVHYCVSSTRMQPKLSTKSECRLLIYNSFHDIVLLCTIG